MVTGGLGYIGPGDVTRPEIVGTGGVAARTSCGTPAATSTRTTSPAHRILRRTRSAVSTRAPISASFATGEIMRETAPRRNRYNRPGATRHVRADLARSPA